MPKIIDLTASIGDPRIPIISFFPRITLEQFNFHEKHGRSNTKISMPIHVGTHIDSPYHFFREGTTVDELPLDRLIGEAVRLDLRKTAKENTPVALEEIQNLAKFQNIDLKDRIAVLQTGWAEKAFFKANFYTENPFLAEDTSRWLIAQGIKSLALDHPIDAAMSPGSHPVPGDSPNHRLFLGNGIPLIENIINLETFDNVRFQMMALPIKVYRCDGAPARVIAMIG